MLSLTLILCSPAPAATRRAVIVGIDTYELPYVSSATRPPAPARWINLNGAVNDALAVRDILAHRFEFQPENMIVLTNTIATRAAILDALKTHLVNASKPGDTALFYFAGHGSQVMNSLSPEINRRDETIVPADSSRGGADIRDKELRALLNAMLDRGAKVTVILDSCHSGSATRGAEGKARFIEPDLRDVADGSPRGPNPEARGAVVLAATQDWDVALETRDGDGRPHGAFSLALVQTLRSMPVRESTERLFLRVRALIQSSGRRQEPILAASAARRKAPLFGETEGSITVRPSPMAVLSVNAAGEVELQGGRAIGLSAGCVLRSSRRSDTPDADVPVRLEVDRVTTLSRSFARVITGSTDAVAPGDLFEIEQWVAPEENGIRLWIVPEVESDTSGRALSLALRQRIAADTRAIALVDQRDAAHYFLRRRTTGSSHSYALVLADASISESGTTSPDAPLSVLPLRTDWHDLTAGEKSGVQKTADALFESASHLARIRGWMTLEPPPDNGNFPFRLALRNALTGERISTGTLHEGDRFGLVLHDEHADTERYIERRFVYVFMLDSSGASTLLFPADGVNVENQFPVQGARMAVIPLGPETLFEVAPPFGVDSFIMLSCAEAIPDPSVLEFDGVITRGSTAATPFARLLSDTGRATRGVKRHRVPANWSIERLTFGSGPSPVLRE